MKTQPQDLHYYFEIYYELLFTCKAKRQKDGYRDVLYKLKYKYSSILEQWPSNFSDKIFHGGLPL